MDGGEVEGGELDGDRRGVLRSLGVGALGTGLLDAVVGEGGVAEEALLGAGGGGIETRGDLRITLLEIGHSYPLGRWESAEHVGNDQATGFFDVRIDVKGCDTSTGTVELAYMVAVVRDADDPENVCIEEVGGSEFARDVSSDRGSVTVTFGGPTRHGFWPGAPGQAWTPGRYRVYAAVIDVNQSELAWRLSDPFEVG